MKSLSQAIQVAVPLEYQEWVLKEFYIQSNILIAFMTTKDNESLNF